MKKIVCLCLLMMLFIVSNVIAYNTSTATFNQREHIKDKTIFTDDVAYTNSSKGFVSQKPFKINNGQTASITVKIKKNDKSYDICMDFKDVDLDLINIKKLKKKKFFFDEDMTKNIQKYSDNIVCFKQFNKKDEINFDFEAEYYGAGIIKYDIFILPSRYNKDFSKAEEEGTLIILDPYLVGTLSTAQSLSLYMKFDGDIDVAHSTTIASFTASDTTLNHSEHDVSYSEDEPDALKDPTYFYDGSYATYSWVNFWTPNSVLDFSANKPDGTTGQIIQYKYGFYYDDEGFRTITFTKNNTIPESCLDAYDNEVRYRVVMNAPTSQSSSFYLYCDYGTGFTELDSDTNPPASDSGTIGQFYESSYYSTNESDYNSVVELNTTSTYRLMPDNSAVAGYDFAFEGNSNDVFGSNDGTVSGATLTSDGYRFTGMSDNINFTSVTGYTTLSWRMVVSQQETPNNYYTFQKGGFNNDNFDFGINQPTIGSLGFLCGARSSAGDKKILNLASHTNVLNQFYDIVCVANGTHMLGYVDGQYKSNIAMTGIQDSSYNTYVGMNLNGTIDSVYIYNTSLTEEQILRLYNDGDYTENVLSESDSAISFNGDDRIITSLDYPISDQPISYSLWLNHSDNDGRIMGTGSSGNGFYLQSYGAGVTQWWFNGSSHNIVLPTSSLNGWMHIVGTYDGTTARGYLNGELIDSVALNTLTTGNSNITIGSHSEGLTNTYDGDIDEFMVFDYALTQNEVLNLYGGFNNTLNLTFKDIETNTIISDNLNVEIIQNSTGYYRSRSTSSGNLLLNGLGGGEVAIYASGTNYYLNEQALTLSETEHKNLTMYMMKRNATNVGKLFTYTLDEYYYAIKGADVRLQQFFPEDLDYKEVAQCYTDSNGECVFNIILEDEKYIVTSQRTIDGVLLSTRSSDIGNYFTINNTEIELYLRYEDSFTLPENFDLVITPNNETLIGNTSYLSAYFYDPEGNDHNVCIKFEYIDGITKVNADEECVTSSSGTINIGGGYLLDRNYTYIATIFTKNETGSVDNVYYTYTYNKFESFSNIFDLYVEIVIILLVAALLGVSLMLSNITVFSLGMIPVSILAGNLDNTSFSPLIIAVIIIICLGITYVARKTNDNEAI